MLVSKTEFCLSCTPHTLLVVLWAVRGGGWIFYEHVIGINVYTPFHHFEARGIVDLSIVGHIV